MPLEDTEEEKRNCLKDIFPYSERTANYLINISNRYKYIYFETSKVACSTIKRTLQQLEVEGTEQVLDDNIHDKVASPLLSPLQLQRSLDNYINSWFTFGFVRNPYTRIISCYLNKIVGDQCERDKFLPHLGVENTAKLSFIDFLKTVRQFEPHEMNHHWMPMSLMLAADKIDLDFIGRQETFNSDFVKVIAHLKNEPVSSNIISDERAHSVNAASKVEKYIDDEAAKLISEIYYDDFKYYGYGFDASFA